ncbi:MarR family winged helix-turn-helix transcriptional regulator [Saccharomonospora xinjiangensis]|nr:HTH-type transcriptional repressor NicR [Saccharomonospora xinjiangensis]
MLVVSRLHDDLHWTLARLKLSLGAAEAEVVARHGMDLWGYTTLMTVADAPAGSQLALAKTMEVDKSKLVAILDDLEAAGYVVRKPDPADRRARIIEATPEGMRALHAASAEVAAIEDSLLADLGEDERDTLRTALRKLVGEPVARLDGGGPAPDACAGQRR